MSVLRTTEIKASSTKSFDDAMREGITRARRHLENVKSAWIQNQEVLLNDKGKIAEFRIQMKITFLLQE